MIGLEDAISQALTWVDVWDLNEETSEIVLISRIYGIKPDRVYAIAREMSYGAVDCEDWENV